MTGPATVEAAVEYADEFGLTHPIIVDRDQEQIPYVITGYPTFVVIDRDMVIRSADLWPWDPDFVTDLL